MTPENLKKNFGRCKNWEEKYLYLVELGERYCLLSSLDQIAENRVSGCQSQVWITLHLSPSSSKLLVSANSDSAVVRGLLALIIIVYDSVDISEALSFDVRFWFSELSLSDHLTPTRTMGLNSVINTIRKKLVLLTIKGSNNALREEGVKP